MEFLIKIFEIQADDVSHLDVLQMSPRPFHRIEVRRVGRQLFERGLDEIWIAENTEALGQRFDRAQPLIDFAKQQRPVSEVIIVSPVNSATISRSRQAETEAGR